VFQPLSRNYFAKKICYLAKVIIFFAKIISYLDKALEILDKTIGNQPLLGYTSGAETCISAAEIHGFSRWNGDIQPL